MDNDLRAVGARFRKNTDTQKAAESATAVDPGESLRIRGKMIGVLLRDARVAAGRSVEDCARVLRITPEQIDAFEFGEEVPTLPQLEILAYYLEVPVSHFWGQSTLEATREDYTRAQNEYMALRDRMIGALLRKAREDAGRSLEQVASDANMDAATVEQYELGEISLPLHELTVLATVLRKNMSYFMESSSHLGELLSLRERWKVFSELPEDLRTFASNPLNVGFIEIAMAFSQMPTQKLRSIAESILNITL